MAKSGTNHRSLVKRETRTIARSSSIIIKANVCPFFIPDIIINTVYCIARPRKHLQQLSQAQRSRSQEGEGRGNWRMTETLILAFEYFHLKKRFSSGQETQLTTATRTDLQMSPICLIASSLLRQAISISIPTVKVTLCIATDQIRYP